MTSPANAGLAQSEVYLMFPLLSTSVHREGKRANGTSFLFLRPACEEMGSTFLLFVVESGVCVQVVNINTLKEPVG